MVRYLRLANYRSMRWKNGKGSTQEILLKPDGVKFPEEEFLWRLSSAQVSSSGPFSFFPGYRRLLTVWQGEGLKLNDKILLPLEVFEFAGEDLIECSPCGANVLDLGLIFASNLEASMKPLRHSARLSQSGVQILFSVGGKMQVNCQLLDVGETVYVEDGELNAEISGDAAAVYIHLQPRSKL